MGIYLNVYDIWALSFEFVTREVLDSISSKLRVLTTSLPICRLDNTPVRVLLLLLLLLLRHAQGTPFSPSLPMMIITNDERYLLTQHS